MKLLVTDYDNTYELHYNKIEDEKIFKKNIISLKKFMKQNILCVATGRHFDAIFKTIKSNNIKFNYLCANNGAELYNQDYNLLMVVPIDSQDLNKVVMLGKKYNIYFRNPYNSKLITSINIYIEDQFDFFKVKNYLNKNLKHSFIEYKFPKIKIINKCCNKSNIITLIKQIEKISNSNIYTIGDDVNDINMIKNYNGFSLITANDNVKKYAKKVFNELNELVYELIE